MCDLRPVRARRRRVACDDHAVGMPALRRRGAVVAAEAVAAATTVAVVVIVVVEVAVFGRLSLAMGLKAARWVSRAPTRLSS